MSKGAISFNEQNFEYYTPKYIVDMFGTFDYDPATTAAQAKALGIPNYATIDTDGLTTDWSKYKRIWVNPPFYLKYPFLEKAVSTFRRAGNDIYFLMPVSTLTTKAFHEIIEGIGIKVYVPNGRIRFRSIYQDEEKTPAFGCVIVKFQSQNEIELFHIIIPGGNYILNETDV